MTPSTEDSAQSNERLEDRFLLGIDVGGTNVKMGLVNMRGEMHARASTATSPLKTPQNIFAYAMDFAAEKLLQMNLATADLAGVGVAVPGVLDSREHILREVVNLPGWQGEPLLEILSEASRLPSIVINDANSAAYAEYTRRGLDDQSLALVTLGTGIGCGLVVQGSPYSGDHGCAGELGHLAIEFGEDALSCTCGSRGHLESYAGAGGVIARLRNALAKHSGSIAPCLLGDDVTPSDVASEAELGNLLCQHVIDHTAQYVGRAVGMMAQVIDPAVVLLGGAMTFGGDHSNTGRGFLSKVCDTVKQTTLVQVSENLVIDFASLGNDAGVLGAAMVAKQAYNSD